MTKNCCEIDMRHDGFQAIISGANPIPPATIRMAYRRWPRPPADVDLGHAAYRTFARAGYSRLGRQLVRDTQALMRGENAES